jgi:hypothetical protein
LKKLLKELKAKYLRKDDFMQISDYPYGVASLSRSSSYQTVNSTNASENYEGALSSLVSAIASSNLADAHQALAQVNQYAAQTSEPDTPLSSFLSNVTDALSRNDITDAQSALSTLRGQSSAVSITTEEVSSYNEATTSTAGRLGKNVFSLAVAIHSGDLNAAKQSYTQLTSQLSSSDLKNTDGETANMQLQKIGESLSVSNISSAQMALDGLLTSLSAGSLVKATA